MTRVLVLGTGVSGLAASRLARRKGMAVTLFAESPAPEAAASGMAVASGPWDRHLLTGVDLVVASPGFPERSLPVVETLEAGIPLWSEIEFASSFTDTPMVAITGTNGKTTVTEATSTMLNRSGIDAPATGNIGDPLSDFVDRRHQALVVETSSFQLRFIEKFHPVAAAITNLAEDHLDWHGSVASYGEAKRNIYRNQTRDDLLVYDADDKGASELAGAAPSRTFAVSGARLPEGGGGVDGAALVVGDVSVPLASLQMRDPIHLTNLAMSSALALWMGARPEAVAAAAVEFRPGAHRRQLVAERGGVRWVDDSKATNVHAALASIRAHPRVILIAGGLDKGSDVSVLALEPNLRLVLGIGEAGHDLAERAGEIGTYAGTIEEAVRIAAAKAVRGDTILLAPGCASFDQFGSYGERGDRFQELVGQVKTEDGQE